MKKYTGISAAICLVVFASVHCAPASKSSSPQTVFDQKQTGDYNIQLHLKDFQIIALLAGDSGFGDYDYNYDYSDFTIKPSTHKPQTSTSPSSSTPSSSFPTSIPTSSSRPSYLTQQPLLPSSTTVKPSPTTSKPEPSTAKPLEDVLPVLLEAIPQKVVENNTLVNEKNNTIEEVVAFNAIKPEKIEEMFSPGKIKVQIIETPLSMSSVPGEDNLVQSAVVNSMPQGPELVQVRKCASGFTRDQKGRCRRVRKPGGSSSLIGFSRLANNIASRLVKDSTRSTSIESS